MGSAWFPPLPAKDPGRSVPSMSSGRRKGLVTTGDPEYSESLEDCSRPSDSSGVASAEAADEMPVPAPMRPLKAVR
jgi:hypothetical protein